MPHIATTLLLAGCTLARVGGETVTVVGSGGGCGDRDTPPITFNSEDGSAAVNGNFALSARVRFDPGQSRHNGGTILTLLDGETSGLAYFELQAVPQLETVAFEFALSRGGSSSVFKQLQAAAPDIQDGGWHTVVVAVSTARGVLVIEVDGVRQAEVDFTGGLVPCTNGCRLIAGGGGDTEATPLSGCIADVSLDRSSATGPLACDGELQAEIRELCPHMCATCPTPTPTTTVTTTATSTPTSTGTHTPGSSMTTTPTTTPLWARFGCSQFGNIIVPGDTECESHAGVLSKLLVACLSTIEGTAASAASSATVQCTQTANGTFTVLSDRTKGRTASLLIDLLVAKFNKRAGLDGSKDQTASLHVGAVLAFPVDACNSGVAALNAAISWYIAGNDAADACGKTTETSTGTTSATTTPTSSTPTTSTTTTTTASTATKTTTTFAPLFECNDFGNFVTPDRDQIQCTTQVAVLNSALQECAEHVVGAGVGAEIECAALPGEASPVLVDKNAGGAGANLLAASLAKFDPENTGAVNAQLQIGFAIGINGGKKACSAAVHASNNMMSSYLEGSFTKCEFVESTTPPSTTSMTTTPTTTSTTAPITASTSTSATTASATTPVATTTSSFSTTTSTTEEPPTTTASECINDDITFGKIRDSGGFVAHTCNEMPKVFCDVVVRVSASGDDDDDGGAGGSAQRFKIKDVCRLQCGICTSTTTTRTETVTTTTMTTETATTTTSATNTETTSEGCKVKTNIMFVIDASTSIDHVEMCGRPGNFKRLLGFAADVLQRVESNHRDHVNTPAPDAKDVQVGCVTYANNANIEFRPAAGQNTSSVSDRLAAIKYVGGNGLFSDSNVHIGIDYANRALRIARSAPSTVVVLTDGRARDAEGSNMTNLLIRELTALELQNPGTKFWAVGIGCDVNYDELALLARNGFYASAVSLDQKRFAHIEDKNVVDNVADFILSSSKPEPGPYEDCAGSLNTMNLDLFPPLDFPVSLTFLVKIPAETTGDYIISKSTNGGSRYFGIWIGPTAAKGVVFFYRRSATADTQHSVSWPILVADGTMHELNIVVDESTAALNVPTLGYSGGEELLGGTIDDCGGGTDDDDGDCITYLGRRAGSSFVDAASTTTTTTTDAPATTTTGSGPAAINLGRIGIAAYSLLDRNNANIEGSSSSSSSSGGGVSFVGSGNDDASAAVLDGNGGYSLHVLPPPVSESARGWTFAVKFKQAAGTYGYIAAKSSAPSASGKSWLRHYALYSSKSRGLVFYYHYSDGSGTRRKASLTIGADSQVNDGNVHTVVLAVAPPVNADAATSSVAVEVLVDSSSVFSGALKGEVSDCNHDDDDGSSCIFDVAQRRNAAGKGTARFQGTIYTALILPDKEIAGFPTPSTSADNRGTAVDWLADGNHNPTGFPEASGGGYIFRGDDGMAVLSRAQTVASSQWSLTLKIRSQEAGSGYLFAKSTSSGITRYRSIYISSSKRDVAFYYQTVDSSSGGGGGSAKRRRSLRFPIYLGDGAEYSIVLSARLTSDGVQEMVLFVDDIMVGAPQQLPDGTELNDCSPSCTLFLGQRASSSSSSRNHYRFTGAIHEAAFVDRVALTAYPS
eukprot:gene10573-34415_t